MYYDDSSGKEALHVLPVENISFLEL